MPDQLDALLEEQFAAMGGTGDSVHTMGELPAHWNGQRERDFRAWYGPLAQQNGIDPNPDHPDHHYNYRLAFDAGAAPGADGHWPSAFKDASHPNRYVGGQDTITGSGDAIDNLLEEQWQAMSGGSAAPHTELSGVEDYQQEDPRVSRSGDLQHMLPTSMIPPLAVDEDRTLVGIGLTGARGGLMNIAGDVARLGQAGIAAAPHLAQMPGLVGATMAGKAADILQDPSRIITGASGPNQFDAVATYAAQPPIERSGLARAVMGRLGGAADAYKAEGERIQATLPARTHEPYTPSWFAAQIGASAPGMALSMAGGAVGGAVGGPAGAYAGVSLPTFLQEAGSEASDIFRDLKAQGMSDEDALTQAFLPSVATGIANAAIENIGGPERRIIQAAGGKQAFHGARELAKSVLKGAAGEAAEEVSQGTISEGAQALATGQPIAPGFLGRRAQEAAVAALMGAGGDVIVEGGEKARERAFGKTKEEIDAEGNGVQPQARGGQEGLDRQGGGPLRLRDDEPDGQTVAVGGGGSGQEAVRPATSEPVIGHSYQDRLQSLRRGERAVVTVPPNDSFELPDNGKYLQTMQATIVYDPSKISRVELLRAVAEGRDPETLNAGQSARPPVGPHPEQQEPKDTEQVPIPTLEDPQTAEPQAFPDHAERPSLASDTPTSADQSLPGTERPFASPDDVRMASEFFRSIGVEPSSRTVSALQRRFAWGWDRAQAAVESIRAGARQVAPEDMKLPPPEAPLGEGLEQSGDEPAPAKAARVSRGEQGHEVIGDGAIPVVQDLTSKSVSTTREQERPQLEVVNDVLGGGKPEKVEVAESQDLTDLSYKDLRNLARERELPVVFGESRKNLLARLREGGSTAPPAPAKQDSARAAPPSLPVEAPTSDHGEPSPASSVAVPSPDSTTPAPKKRYGTKRVGNAAPPAEAAPSSVPASPASTYGLRAPQAPSEGAPPAPRTAAASDTTVPSSSIEKSSVSRSDQGRTSEASGASGDSTRNVLVDRLRKGTVDPAWVPVNTRPGSSIADANLVANIRQGQMRLQTGRDALGKDIPADQLEAVRTSVRDGIIKLEEMRAPPAETKPRFGETKPAKGETKAHDLVARKPESKPEQTGANRRDDAAVLDVAASVTAQGGHETTPKTGKDNDLDRRDHPTGGHDHPVTTQPAREAAATPNRKAADEEAQGQAAPEALLTQPGDTAPSAPEKSGGEVSHPPGSAGIGKGAIGVSKTRGVGGAVVDQAVLTGGSQSQILDAVIGAIPVDVVDMLGGKKRTTEMLLHDEPVLADALATARGFDVPAFVEPLLSVIAKGRTKLSLGKATGRDAKRRSTLDTLDRNLREAVTRAASPESLAAVPTSEELPHATSRTEASATGLDLAGDSGEGGSAKLADANDAHREIVPQSRTDKTDKHKYSSTQVDISGPVAAALKRASLAIAEEDLADDGRETNFHATVKYGLESDDPEAVRAIVEAAAPFTAKLGETSIFAAKEGADYDVVKADVESPELHALNKAIADATPHTDTHPTFQPHVTLAYVKPGKGAKYAGRTDLLGRRVKVDRVVFSDRDGKTTEIMLKGTPAKKAFGARKAPVTTADTTPTGQRDGPLPPAIAADLATLADRAQAKIDEIKENAKKRMIKRGRSTGSQIIGQELRDAAMVAFLKAVKAGDIAGRALTKHVKAAIAELKSTVDAAKVRRIVKGLIRDAAGDFSEAKVDETLNSLFAQTTKARVSAKSVDRETGVTPERNRITVDERKGLAKQLKVGEKAAADGVKFGEYKSQYDKGGAAYKAEQQLEKEREKHQRDKTKAVYGYAAKAALNAYRAGAKDAVRDFETQKLPQIRNKIALDNLARQGAAFAAGEKSGGEEAKFAREQVRGVRATLVEAVREMPKAVRHEMLTELRDVNTYPKLSRALDRLQAIATEYTARKEAAAAVRLTKDKSLLKLPEDGDAGSKPRQEAQDAAQAIRTAWRALQAKLEEFRGAAQSIGGLGTKNPMLPADRTRILGEIADLAANISDSARTIASLFHDEKTKFTDYVRGQKVASEIYRKSLRDDLEANAKPIMHDDGAKAAEAFVGRRIARWLVPVATLMKRIDGRWDAGGRWYNTVIRNFQHGQRAKMFQDRATARKAEDAAKAAGYESMGDAYKRLAGTFGERYQEKVTIRVGSRDVEVPKGAAMDIWAHATDANTSVLLQQGQTISFRKNRFGKPQPVDLRSVHRALTPVERAFVEDMKGLKDELFAEMDATHRRLKGTSLDRQPGHWSRVRNRDMSERVGQADGWRSIADFHLENSGFLQRRVGGRLPILVGDFLTNWHRQVESMLQFTHMAEPVRSAERLTMHPEQKPVIQQHYGESMVRRLQRAIVDAGGTRQFQDLAWYQRVIRSLTARVGRALTTINRRSWLKQLGGISTLLHSMDMDTWSHGLAGMFRKGVGSRMIEHSADFWSRYQSAPHARFTGVTDGFDALEGASSFVTGAKATAGNLVRGRLIGADAALQQTLNQIRISNFFDSVPARLAWAGYEWKVEQAHPAWSRERKMRWVAERAWRAFSETQNTTGALDSGVGYSLAKQDPVLAANLLFTSDASKKLAMVYEAAHQSPARAFKTAAAILGNAAWATAVMGGTGSLLYAAIRSLFGPGVDQRDKEEAKRRARLDAEWQMAQELAATVPGMSTAVGTARSAIQGHDTPNLFDNPTAQAVNDMVGAVVDITRDLAKDPPVRWNRHQLTRQQKMLRSLGKFARSASTLEGLPASPLANEIRGVMRADDLGEK